jgi:DNA-binding MarR family transcriptional regulator
MARVTPRRRQRKSELGLQLQCLGRDVGTAALVFHQTVADRLGLNPTDHKCLELLHHATDPTAGDLAEWTALTTGAVTGVIDRLERRGFVRREAHPTDRRKVIIRTIPERYDEVANLFSGIAEKMGKLCSAYSEAELTIITEHMARSAEIFRSETQRLREPSTRRAADVNTPVAPRVAKS